MFILRSFTAVLALLAAGIEASPLVRRDVIRPKITSPTKDSVWPVGSTQTVTWDTSDFPPVSQITNIIGKVVLGFDENDSLNLDFNHPLAANFNLTDGSVKVKVPNVKPRDDYLIVLFGDSGNTSPSFSITKISAGNASANVSVPTSASASSTETLITTPIPITGSVITGGPTPSATDATTTGTATNSNTAPLPTPTDPSTVTPSSASGTASASSAGASTATSAAWSVRDPVASSNMKTFSFCATVIVAFFML